MPLASRLNLNMGVDARCFSTATAPAAASGAAPAAKAPPGGGMLDGLGIGGGPKK